MAQDLRHFGPLDDGHPSGTIREDDEPRAEDFPLGQPRTTVDLDLVIVNDVGMTRSEKKWFDRMVDLAEHVALWSKDPRTKVGSVVVGADRRNVAVGYNGFPPGVKDTEERLSNREVKYHFMQHAERAVIDNAQFDLAGATIYVTMHPCSDCAKSIVAKKMRRVVCPSAPTEEPWATSAAYAKTILAEGGVQVVTIAHVY